MTNITDHDQAEAHPQLEMRPMKHPDPIPKAALWGMFGLVMIVLAGVTLARVVGMEPLNTPQGGEIAIARTIVFETREDGGMNILEPGTGAMIQAFPNETGGFILGAHRAFMFERKRTGGTIDMAGPMELVRWADGRMSLMDPQTGWRAEVHNFGINAQANFARILEAQG